MEPNKIKAIFMKRKSNYFIFVFWIIFTMSIAVWIAVKFSDSISPDSDIDVVHFIFKTSLIAFVSINIFCPVLFYSCPFSFRKSNGKANKIPTEKE